MREISNTKIDKNLITALSILRTIDIDFYLTGGIISDGYLNEHARITTDIDIRYSCDVSDIKKAFYEKFDVILFYVQPEDSTFYLETFCALVLIDNEKVRIDGTKINFSSKIRKVDYRCNDFIISGVPVEFIVAEKILSLLNELDRPYKHLIDVYSFSCLEEGVIDYTELRKYIFLINEKENEARVRLGFPELVLSNKISDNKQFAGKVIIPTLQSKYLLSKEEFIDGVNKWLKSIL